MTFIFNVNIFNTLVWIIYTEINAAAPAAGDTIIFIYYHTPSPVALAATQWF